MIPNVIQSFPLFPNAEILFIGYPGRVSGLYPDTAPKPHGAEVLVIYIHGFASHQRGEEVLFLRDRFTALGAAYLAFDHRGHGSSSGTMKGLTIRRNLGDLGALIQEKGKDFKKRILIGSSMGGQTAA